MSSRPGDELAKGLLEFAEQEKLSAASFKAVGALSSVRLGWFSWESKKYEPSVTLDEQMELLSLIGDVALKDGKPIVHAHAVIGKKDGTAHGGHLLEAQIRPTCEVVLTESPTHLQKFIDPESGLALIKPSRPGRSMNYLRQYLPRHSRQRDRRTSPSVHGHIE